MLYPEIASLLGTGMRPITAAKIWLNTAEKDGVGLVLAYTWVQDIT
jgi:hypothetical protein